GQERPREPPGRAPPTASPPPTSSISPVVHAESQRHAIPIVIRRGPIIIAPGLVLIPGIHLPFTCSLGIVVEIVVVEKAIPVLDAHVHRVITREFVYIKVFLDELPLRRARFARQSAVECDQVVRGCGSPGSLPVLANQALLPIIHFVKESTVVPFIAREKRFV